MQATNRQLFALFCITKVVSRNLGLQMEQASDLIKRAKNGEQDAVRKELINLGGVPKGQPAAAKGEHQALYDKAYAAGMEAGNAKTPRPMIVTEHQNVLDDSSPVKQAWHVPSGVCGFASVAGINGNSGFGKWLVKNGKGRKDSYRGGVFVWVSEFGQSLEKKEAFASAFAGVLQGAGVSCYVDSRMD